LGKVWEDLSLDVITVDLGGGRRLWRQEAGSIILLKNQETDFLYEKHIWSAIVTKQLPNIIDTAVTVSKPAEIDLSYTKNSRSNIKFQIFSRFSR